MRRRNAVAGEYDLATAGGFYVYRPQKKEKICFLLSKRKSLCYTLLQSMTFLYFLKWSLRPFLTAILPFWGVLFGNLSALFIH